MSLEKDPDRLDLEIIFMHHFYKIWQVQYLKYMYYMILDTQ